jgi:hypothetical protein
MDQTQENPLLALARRQFGDPMRAAVERSRTQPWWGESGGRIPGLPARNSVAGDALYDLLPTALMGMGASMPPAARVTGGARAPLESATALNQRRGVESATADARSRSTDMFPLRGEAAVPANDLVNPHMSAAQWDANVANFLQRLQGSADRLGAGPISTPYDRAVLQQSQRPRFQVIEGMPQPGPYQP